MMKKCVLFFIGLICALVVAIMTDGQESGLLENKFANSDGVDVNKKFAENKMVPAHEVWKR